MKRPLAKSVSEALTSSGRRHNGTGGSGVGQPKCLIKSAQWLFLENENATNMLKKLGHTERSSKGVGRSLQLRKSLLQVYEDSKSKREDKGGLTVEKDDQEVIFEQEIEQEVQPQELIRKLTLSIHDTICSRLGQHQIGGGDY